MSHPISPNSSCTLTVAMIVRDEHEVLSATLDSIRSIADQIVVIDTGSADASPQISRDAGATVIDYAWNDDFAAARNAAIAHLTGDWILWLDAGETLTSEHATQLRTMLGESADPKKVYCLFVEVPRHAGTVSSEQVARLRLVPRGAGLRFQGRVRESMMPSVVEAGLEVELLDLRIHRTDRDHERSRRIDRAVRTLQLAQLEIDADDSQAEMHLARADALATLGRNELAIAEFRETIRRAQRGSTCLLEAYYGLLTCYDGQTEMGQTQIETCLEALDIYPLDAQLLCAMGGYMLQQSRPELAQRSYRICFENGQIDPLAWHLSDLAEVGASCLGLTEQLLGKPDEAQATLSEALGRYPESERLRRQLINLHIKQGQAREALAQFDRLPAELPHREALGSAIRGALLAGQENWTAALPYLKTAWSTGCRDSICMKWLAVTYLMNGDVDAARPVLDEWQQLEPENAEARIYLANLEAKQTEQQPVSETTSAAGDEPARQIRFDKTQTTGRQSGGGIPLPTEDLQISPNLSSEPPAAT